MSAEKLASVDVVMLEMKHCTPEEKKEWMERTLVAAQDLVMKAQAIPVNSANASVVRLALIDLLGTAVNTACMLAGAPVVPVILDYLKDSAAAYEVKNDASN
jgi:hypothetical protein